MGEGTSRVDVAFGVLGPDVVARHTSMPDADSGGTVYYMPAAGWVQKQELLTFGVGMFVQGGMGTEYEESDWVGAGSGLTTRSEVGMGNIVVPVAYDITPDLTIGGSFDYVWGWMGLQMAMPAGQMGGLAASGNLTASGAGALGLPGFLGGVTNVGYFDFSDEGSTENADATGWAGKLGVTYKVVEKLTLGAAYHSKTRLGDYKASGAQMRMIDNAGTMGGAAGTTYTLTGDINLVDFQFPETYGAGLAYQVRDDLMLVADYKRIGWARAMKDFHMTFSSADMGGISMDMRLPQDWKDQDVFNFGLAYRTTAALTLRAGVNLANNPIPDNTVSPLFPAIVKHHYTFGAGYAFFKVSELNASLAYVPKVTSITPATSGSYSIDHSQVNWQLMYTYRF